MRHRIFRIFGWACLGGFVTIGARAQPARPPALDAWIPVTVGSESYPSVFSYSVASPDTQRTRPPLKAGHLIGQYAGGMIGGGLFGIAVGIGGYILLNENVVSCDDWPCELGVLEMAFATGFALGSAVGVQAVGGIHYRTAPFLATLGGSALGVILVVIASSNSAAANGVEQWLYLSMPTFGAMIAFNALRRYWERSPSGEVALLHRADGAWRLGVPLVTRQPDPLTFGQTNAYQVRLVQVAF